MINPTGLACEEKKKREENFGGGGKWQNGLKYAWGTLFGTTPRTRREKKRRKGGKKEGGGEKDHPLLRFADMPFWNRKGGEGKKKGSKEGEKGGKGSRK